MENLNEDTTFAGFQSNAKRKFLQQVKECQQRLECIEKLFFDTQEFSETDMHFEKSQNSLNDIINKQSKLNSSFPDLQLLMHEFENKINSKNNLSKESGDYSPRSEKQTPLNVKVESVNNTDSSSPFTFVVQVPSSVLGLLKRQLSNDRFSDFSSQCSTDDVLKSRKKTRFISVLQRLFKKRKRDALSTAHTDVLEKIKILHFLNEQNTESAVKSFSNSNTSNSSNLNYKPEAENIGFFNNNSVTENAANLQNSKVDNSKEKQTLIFPITYHFDEKSSSNVKPNLTIHHEIVPETNLHSIKIANEIPMLSSQKPLNQSSENEKNQTENSKKGELQSVEALLENLIKTLVRTTEKLNDLETIKSYMENLIDKDKESKTKRSRQEKTLKIKSSKESLALIHLIHHVMAHMENKKNKTKVPEKIKQTPKRQSSKLSVCSSPGESSTEEFYKNPITVNKPSTHTRRRTRYQSPSRLNYLVCQSERDVDYKFI